MRGRPRVTREPDSRRSFTMWISRELRDRLVEEAKRNYRPLAREVEYRLMQSAARDEAR